MVIRGIPTLQCKLIPTCFAICCTCSSLLLSEAGLSTWHFKSLSKFDAQHWIWRFEKDSRLEVDGQDSKTRCKPSLRRASIFGMW